MNKIVYNGSEYSFPDSLDVAQLLAIHATHIGPAPADKALAPGCPYAKDGKVYTHDAASYILEAFEDLLDAKQIEVPCDDPDEEAERHNGGNGASLYGTEYSGLLDQIENELASILGGAGIPIATDEFSGIY